MLSERKNRSGGWWFVAFPLAIIFLFTALPTVAGVTLSLFEWTGGAAARFIGVQNFVHAATDVTLGRALRNTLIFALVSAPITVVLAFPIAVALQAPWFIGRTTVRTVVFLPTIISIVAIGLIWRWVLEPSSAGLLNHLLDQIAGLPHALGLTAAAPKINWPNWFGNSPWGLSTLIAVSVWRNLGFSIVLYLAALGGVPQSSYDAAAVDGAGPWKVMWSVTWPGVRPMTLFLLITGMIGALQVFDIVYVMIGTIEQPWTDVLNLYLYREFTRSRLGYAATVGVVILVVTALVTAAQLVWMRRGEVRV